MLRLVWSCISGVSGGTNTLDSSRLWLFDSITWSQYRLGVTDLLGHFSELPLLDDFYFSFLLEFYS